MTPPMARWKRPGAAGSSWRCWRLVYRPRASRLRRLYSSRYKLPQGLLLLCLIARIFC